MRLIKWIMTAVQVRNFTKSDFAAKLLERYKQLPEDTRDIIAVVAIIAIVAAGVSILR